MSMFQHFIITRFNLRKKEWDTTRENTKVLTDSWMENRLQLFEKYCYSSLKHQSNKNFKWLVFFDTNTEDKYRKEITRLAKDFPLFEPLFIDGMGAFLAEIKNTIKSQVTQPYIITTRLDNDDSLHEDFINEVQQQFSQQDFQAIDFIDGLTLQVEPEVKLGKRSHVHNPFISLIEKLASAESAKDFETVWQRERHGEWSKVKQLKSIRGKYLWMSIIHAENKANNYLGYGEVSWEDIEKFHINSERLDSLKRNSIVVQQWRKESFRNQFRTQWKVGFKLLKRRLHL